MPGSAANVPIYLLGERGEAGEGCSPRTERCADARDYEVELRECCRSHVIQIVGRLVTLLNEAGIPFWADYGTLLGAVRNPMTTWDDYPWLPKRERTTEGPHAGIIPHDKDADLCLLGRDMLKLTRIKWRLRREGFFVQTFRRGTWKVLRSSRNHTNVDLFFWWEKKDGTLYRRRYASVDKCKGKEFPKSWLEPMTTVEWEGLELPAPADPEAFLAFRYGDNWRTPIAANHDGVER